MKNIFLKIFSLIVLAFSSLFALAFLSGIVLIAIYFKDGSFGKIILVDVGLIIAAGISFLIGWSLYHLIAQNITMKEELEEVEETLEHIGGADEKMQIKNPK